MGRRRAGKGEAPSRDGCPTTIGGVSLLTTIFLHHSPLKPDVRPFMASLCAELTDEDIEMIAGADGGWGEEECRDILTEVRSARMISWEQVIACQELFSLTQHDVTSEHLAAVPIATTEHELGRARRVAFASAAFHCVAMQGEHYGLEPDEYGTIRLLHCAIAMGPERTLQAGRFLAATVLAPPNSWFSLNPALWTAVLIAGIASGSCTERQAGAMARAIRLVASRQGTRWYRQLTLFDPKIVVDNVEAWRMMLNRFCSSVGPGYSERSVRELRALESMLTPGLSW